MATTTIEDPVNPLDGKTAGRPFPKAFAVCLFLGVGMLCGIGSLDLVNIHIDDVFITLRYSLNTLNGYGPVFNPGQAVEGYSSPTWMLLISAVSGATGLTSHFAMYWVSRIVGLTFGLLTLVVVYRIAKLRGNGPAAIAASVLAIALSPFLNTYNLAGMETALVTFLLTLTAFFYLAWDQRRTLIYALGFAVALGMVSISRPEGVIYPVAVFAGLLIAGKFKKDNRLPYIYPACAIAVAILAAMVTFRLAFYGELFPNTLYAKNTPGFGTFREGAIYASLFLVIAVLPWAYASAAAFRNVPAFVPQYIPLYLVVVAQIAFVTYAGGDWMPAFRLLLPILPILYFLIFDRLDLRRPEGLKLKIAVLACVVMAFVSLNLQRDYIKNYQDFNSGLRLEVTKYEEDFYQIAQALGAIAKPNERVLVAQAGLIPYLNDQLIFNDIFGLTDKHIAKDLSGVHGIRIDNDYFFAGDYDYVVYAVAKSRPDIDWNGLANGYQTGFVPLDSFLNDKRFGAHYAPVYRGSRGAIFQRIH